MELVERKEEVRWLWSHFLVSQRRICELMGVAESSQRYVSRRNEEELRARLVEAAREKPRWGSFASQRVTRELDRIVAQRGAPEAIRSDNGPEFTSRHFLAWAMERKIELVHIEPGRPVQNAFVESFHGKLRDECLNASWFGNLFEARVKIGAWREEYNEERPHSSLGYVPPAKFARRVAALRSPTAPSARQLGERDEAEVMNSGVSGVV